MIIGFEEQEWELDLERVTLQQAITIQLYTGMSIGDWEDSISVEEKDGKIVNPPPEWVKSIAALYWLMKAQAGEKHPIAEVDFEFGPFLVAVMEAMAREIERAAAEAAAAAAPPEPDPTPPRAAARGPRSSTRSTPRATTRTPRARTPAATASG